MNAIIGNIEALIALYLPVVGTYLIQIIQWIVMWAKMKAQTKLQDEKSKAIDDVIELNKALQTENYVLKEKINKLITLLQHYEEKEK